MTLERLFIVHHLSAGGADPSTAQAYTAGHRHSQGAPGSCQRRAPVERHYHFGFNQMGGAINTQKRLQTAISVIN
jgi:hypothetical protein